MGWHGRSPYGKVGSKMDNELPIMFDDLSVEKQQELLEAHNITDKKEMNWDVHPVTIIPLPD